MPVVVVQFDHQQQAINFNYSSSHGGSGCCSVAGGGCLTTPLQIILWELGRSELVDCYSWHVFSVLLNSNETGIMATTWIHVLSVYHRKSRIGNFVGEECLSLKEDKYCHGFCWLSLSVLKERDLGGILRTVTVPGKGPWKKVGLPWRSQTNKMWTLFDRRRNCCFN